MARGSPNTGQGDPSADGAFQRHQQETDLRITAAAASFTPLRTAAGCFAPHNYLNTVHVAYYKFICNARNRGSELLGRRKREREIESSRSPERSRSGCRLPPRGSRLLLTQAAFQTIYLRLPQGRVRGGKWTKLRPTSKQHQSASEGAKWFPCTIFSAVPFSLVLDGKKTEKEKMLLAECLLFEERREIKCLVWFGFSFEHLATFFSGHWKVTGTVFQSLHSAITVLMDFSSPP